MMVPYEGLGRVGRHLWSTARKKVEKRNDWKFHGQDTEIKGGKRRNTKEIYCTSDEYVVRQ